MKETRELALVLHDIRSTHNVGSLFRTADAAGVSKIYLAGYTPTPLDRYGRPRNDVAKVALGAEKTMPWEHVVDIRKLIAHLREQRYYIMALEIAPRAVDYKTIKPQFPAALILGNEVEGVGSDILAECDAIVSIPMRGTKESLNVGVAGGIALFKLLDA